MRNLAWLPLMAALSLQEKGSPAIFAVPPDRLPDTAGELTMAGGKIVRDPGVVKR
jgi:hypothetical protein